MKGGRVNVEMNMNILLLDIERKRKKTARILILKRILMAQIKRLLKFMPEPEKYQRGLMRLFQDRKNLFHRKSNMSF